MKKLLLILVILAAILNVNCGGHESGNQAPQPPEDPKALAASDLQTLNNYDSRAAVVLDQKYNNIFTRIFGGTSGPDLLKYFHDRISYLIVQSDESTMDTGVDDKAYKYVDFAKDPEMGQRMKNQGVEIGASNVTAGLWILSKVNDLKITLSIGPTSFPFTDPRQGIMEFGSGYSSSEQNEGTTINIPSQYRLMYLIHEARHSDCTGGFYASDIELAKHSPSAQDYTSHSHPECTHQHSYCTKGKFIGLPACDNHPWGAYAVQAVYAVSTLASVRGTDFAIMESAAMDAISRIDLDFDKMMGGAYGQPDMSSSVRTVQ